MLIPTFARSALLLSSRPTLLPLRAVSTLTSPDLYSFFSPDGEEDCGKMTVIDVRPESEIRDVGGFNAGRAITDYLGLAARSTAEDNVKYVPLNDVLSESWLSLSPTEFEDEYDFEHPLHAADAGERRYVFSCKAGIRSAAAAGAAERQGVPNCHNYLDGAVGWDYFMAGK